MFKKFIFCFVFFAMFHFSYATKISLKDVDLIGKNHLDVSNYYITTDSLLAIFPKGSIDPYNGKHGLAPKGGINFRFPLSISSKCLNFSYELKFFDNFDFNRGGKLPGLYGGRGNTGGIIPDGYDGFSFRLAFREKGAGAVYAYIPSSVVHGIDFGRGLWHFKPGNWQKIKLHVKLNELDKKNGELAVFVDEVQLFNNSNLEIVKSAYLSIDGVLFSSFFGGHYPVDASKVDTSIEFRNFSYERCS